MRPHAATARSGTVAHIAALTSAAAPQSVSVAPLLAATAGPGPRPGVHLKSY